MCLELGSRIYPSGNICPITSLQSSPTIYSICCCASGTQESTEISRVKQTDLSAKLGAMEFPTVAFGQVTKKKKTKDKPCKCCNSLIQ